MKTEYIIYAVIGYLVYKHFQRVEAREDAVSAWKEGEDSPDQLTTAPDAPAPPRITRDMTQPDMRLDDPSGMPGEQIDYLGTDLEPEVG